MQGIQKKRIKNSKTQILKIFKKENNSKNLKQDFLNKFERKSTTDSRKQIFK
jgi:hypothetical protein